MEPQEEGQGNPQAGVRRASGREGTEGIPALGGNQASLPSLTAWDSVRLNGGLLPDIPRVLHSRWICLEFPSLTLIFILSYFGR